MRENKESNQTRNATETQQEESGMHPLFISVPPTSEAFVSNEPLSALACILSEPASRGTTEQASYGKAPRVERRKNRASPYANAKQESAQPAPTLSASDFVTKSFEARRAAYAATVRRNIMVKQALDSEARDDEHMEAPKSSAEGELQICMSLMNMK
eukprot:GHVU01036058.1.p1 GENE.GHVU01036058.1~~GHVU01036058.1.p1  ORF type:complete len:157 (+),score=12.23 GHVU01036058.1:128-598(+)